MEFRGKNSLKLFARKQERYGIRKIQGSGNQIRKYGAGYMSTVAGVFWCEARVLYCTRPPRAVEVGNPTCDQQMLVFVAVGGSGSTTFALSFDHRQGLTGHERHLRLAFGLGLFAFLGWLLPPVGERLLNSLWAFGQVR